jgi:hypothetical protein
MRPIIILLFMTLVLTFLTIEAGLVLMTQPDMVQAADSEQEAGPVEFEQVVEFDRDIHFLTPDGKDKVFAPGNYVVKGVENGLRLRSADDEKGKGVIVRAEPGTHNRSVEAPEPLSMSGGDDQYVVMLLLPEGKSLQAVGSSSGVFSRHPHPPKLKPGAFLVV